MVAITAARLGARHVTAFDICPDAVRCARANAVAADVAVDTRLGSWESALGAVRMTSSCPIRPMCQRVPTLISRRSPVRWDRLGAWNAGMDGRLVLDPLCDVAPALLDDGGTMLIVQSEFADADQTVRRRLRRRGLRTGAADDAADPVRSGTARACRLAGSTAGCRSAVAGEAW